MRPPGETGPHKNTIRNTGVQTETVMILTEYMHHMAKTRKLLIKPLSSKLKINFFVSSMVFYDSCRWQWKFVCWNCRHHTHDITGCAVAQALC